MTPCRTFPVTSYIDASQSASGVKAEEGEKKVLLVPGAPDIPYHKSHDAHVS